MYCREAQPPTWFLRHPRQRSVTVDEQPMELAPANLVARGVAVAAGSHRVRFTCEVPGLELGVKLGELGLLAVVSLLLRPAAIR